MLVGMYRMQRADTICQVHIQYAKGHIQYAKGVNPLVPIVFLEGHYLFSKF